MGAIAGGVNEAGKLGMRIKAKILEEKCVGD